MTNWGKLLAEIQMESGVSQRRLSQCTGIHRAAIRKVLAGRNISIHQLEAMFSALGYELDAIKVGPPAIKPWTRPPAKLKPATPARPRRPKKRSLIRIPLHRVVEAI